MPSISSAQIRAARALLDWSMTDLASAAQVSISTVKRFERGSDQPVSDDVVDMMRDAAETEGIRFLPDDGTGLGIRFQRR